MRDSKYYCDRILSYGILSVLLFLEEMERLERYEECEKVVMAIEYLNSIANTKLPTRLTVSYFNTLIKNTKDIVPNASRKSILDRAKKYCNLMVASSVELF